MLPERSATTSIATPSVDISDNTVPFLGRARANIKRAIQINLAIVSMGLSRKRSETGQLLIFVSDGNFTAARRFLRRLKYARTGNGKSNDNTHGEYSCIYALLCSTFPESDSVTSIFFSCDLVVSMKSLTRSNVFCICSVVGLYLANFTRSQCFMNSARRSWSA